jgi:hypothetical protein
MPATLLVAGVLVSPRDLIPSGDGSAARRESAGPASALAIALLAALALSFVDRAASVYAQKDFSIGTPGDEILVANPIASPRGVSVGRALEWLAAVVEPDTTRVALPEGAFFNYWLRLRNPSGFPLFLPSEMDAFGEDRMLSALKADPPDYVLLVHRLAFEFGLAPFGRDPRNGLRVMDWVRSNYERVERIGAEPFEGPRFGIAILRRRGGVHGQRIGRAR